MIHSIKIERLRGILSGSLDGLGPLTIIVGPNGAGKSAILDALLIGSSDAPGAATIKAITRHAMPQSVGGGRWLTWMSGSKGPAQIDIATQNNDHVSTTLEYRPRNPDGPSGSNEIFARCSSGQEIILREGQPNNYVVRSADKRGGGSLRAHLVETWADSSTPLHEIHTRAAVQGTRAQAIRIIQSLVPDMKGLEILTDDSHPFLAADYGVRAVPVSLAGDGVHALVRLCYELAVAGSGLVLLEEPETHQHPAALLQTAAAILAAVRNGVQVVLSTHSLELIDAFVSKAEGDDVNSLSLFRVRLENGLLLTSRLDGKDIVLSRTQIEDDLR